MLISMPLAPIALDPALRMQIVNGDPRDKNGEQKRP